MVLILIAIALGVLNNCPEGFSGFVAPPRSPVVGDNMAERQNNLVDLQSYRAQSLIDEGLDQVCAGDFAGALARFRLSLAAHETAEAYTYCGWMLNSLGDTDEAIAACKQAIRLDPEYGNPYNDIGSYLVQKGELNDAVRWLYKALDAPRYEHRQWPHLNLGKLYLAKRLFKKALYHFHRALELDPGNRQLEFMILDLEDRIH
jgi:Tfp pilus assembly protein PilF